MNLKHIKALCKKGGEKQVVEYKTSTSTLRAAFETICAFLNTHGGTVLIGVKDNGEIIGQHISDATRKDIAAEISKIEPATFINVHYVDLESEKVVISMHVEKGDHAPYVYDSRPFQRDESKTNRMSQHKYEQLLVKRGQLKYSWEDFPVDTYGIDDLDHDEIYRAVEQGIIANRIPASVRGSTIRSILINWDLIISDNGKLKNAAVILFAKKVLPHYQQCHIKLGRFSGTDMLGDLIDNRDFYGNAFQILEETDHFIKRHLPIASFFEEDRFERIDEPTLPVLAVREALVNAICHRDYANRSSAITLAIFDDRMEIWNNGKLPPDLTVAALKQKHKSEPRNKNIARVFYDRKYFDGWGTGTLKIFDLCKKNDVPEPQYQEYSGGIEITFKFRPPTGSDRKKSAPLLNIRQKEILKIIGPQKQLSASEIFSQLKEPPSLRTVKADLSELKKLGLIEQRTKGPNSTWAMKPGSVS